MSFVTSSLTAWKDELGDVSDYILKPILAARTLQMLGVDKREGIRGQSQLIPMLEVTTPFQAGTACGFTTSGDTTLTQLTITSSPIKVQQSICLQDLETFYAQKSLPKGSRSETFQLLDLWTNRILEQTAINVENMLWQGKTTYTNDTHLKQINGFIATNDTAGDNIAATQQASITTSTVRGIIEEIAYTKIPSRIRSLGAAIVCGYDTFNIYLQKLMTDNLYHYDPTNTDLANYKMKVYGTNVTLLGLPGLNNDNAVEVGVLPTAVKNRIFATYEDNFVVAMATGNQESDFDIWFDKNTQLLKFNLRFHLGVKMKYTDLVVQYTNS